MEETLGAEEVWRGAGRASARGVEVWAGLAWLEAERGGMKSRWLLAGSPTPGKQHWPPSHFHSPTLRRLLLSQLHGKPRLLFFPSC